MNSNSIKYVVTLLSFMTPLLHGVGLIISSNQKEIIFAELLLTDNNCIGGFVMPGKTLKLDATVAGIKRIRWIFPNSCELFEVNKEIPGIFGWKEVKIQENRILFESSGFLDPIIGWSIGQKVAY